MEIANEIADARPCAAASGFNDEAKAQMRRRPAGGAAAGARIADEVGHVGAMRALDHANAAIGVGHAHRFAVERYANETTRGPFPDVAADVEQSVGVAAEGADRLRRRHEAGGTGRLGLVTRDPGLRRV